MAKVLYIKTSPRGDRSHSIAVADSFIDAYREKHPDDDIKTIDLFTMDMMPFDGFAVKAKYTVMNGQNPTEGELNAWKRVEATIEEFKAADKYVFAVPMWNFSIPYRLKQYFDILIQPGLTFSFSPDEGYKGLVTGKPVFISYASGGEYSEGPAKAYDYQKGFMETLLGFIGFTDIKTTVVAPTQQGGPKLAAERQKEAISKARKIAETF